MHFSPAHLLADDRATAARAALSVLIVDDEPHVRSYLRMVLGALGVTEVWEAADGSDAIGLFQEHQPAVVLLDVNMPLLSGDETLRRLTTLDPGAAVIVVTSQNDFTTVKRFQELGAMGYVLKHVRREQITATLEELLDSLLDDRDED